MRHSGSQRTLWGIAANVWLGSFKAGTVIRLSCCD